MMTSYRQHTNVTDVSHDFSIKVSNDVQTWLEYDPNKTFLIQLLLFCTSKDFILKSHFSKSRKWRDRSSNFAYNKQFWEQRRTKKISFNNVEQQKTFYYTFTILVDKNKTTHYLFNAFNRIPFRQMTLQYEAGYQTKVLTISIRPTEQSHTRLNTKLDVSSHLIIRN